ncbi:MAG TPA: hemerythrin domain-containing protein [Kofleriaceae bacterium]
MTPIKDALELLTAQHEQIDDLFEQVRQIGDEAAFVELADKLSTHLALEQDVFYPAIAKQLSPEVMNELAAEHAAIKHVIGDLVWLGTRDADFRPKLARLGELLDGHSAWQEDELFTAAAETMTSAELAALCDQFYNFDSIAIAA